MYKKSFFAYVYIGKTFGNDMMKIIINLILKIQKLKKKNIQYIKVRVSARIKRKPTRYEVSVVTRDEVGAYKPYLWEQSVFEKGPMFR